MSIKRNVFAILVLCLMLVLQGCTGGGGGGNKAPKINSFSPNLDEVTVAPGGTIDFSVTASDPDGDSLSYSWKSDKGTFAAPNSKDTKWTAPDEVGTVKVEVTVSDGKAVADHEWTVTIGDVKPPIIASASPVSSEAAPAEVNINEERILAITASDPQGRTLTSNWTCSAGTIKDPELYTAKWVAPGIPGPATVTVTVSNGAKTAEHIWHFDVKGNIVYVTENITTPTTWAAGNIYVINHTQDIYVENTLTIEPGTIIKFGMGKMLNTRGEARIEAVGKEDRPIVFTSLRDDVHGGDTNNDQDATSPASGDWGRILLDTQHGHKFEYCHFLFGGGDYSGIMLDLEDSSGTPVENCVFAFSKGIGLYAVKESNYSLKGNTFYNNDKPLVINVNQSLDDSNTFHNPDNPNETNTYQGIFIDGYNSGSSFTKDVVWAETEVAFVLSGLDFTIEDTASLSLKPGTTVKMGVDRLYVAGYLEAKGTGLDLVRFTSLYDDTVGGKSNGPNSRQPTPGDWECIEVYGRAEFDHCWIAYGGSDEHRYNGYAALYDDFDSSGTKINNTAFVNNLRGLDLLSSKSSIKNSSFQLNVYPLMVGAYMNTDNTLSFTQNKHDAIYIGEEYDYNTCETPTVEWLNTSVPYVLNGDTEFNGTGVVLGDGAIIMVWNEKEITLSAGAGFVNFDKAIFTSYRDKARGGDVGGGVLPPQDGDWEGIYDDNIGDYRSDSNIYYAKYN
ncbi:MAG: Ig-like domain-containing protein [Limnochordia bacterium]